MRGGHGIEQEAGQLVLQILVESTTPGIKEKFGEIRIELASGEILSRSWD